MLNKLVLSFVLSVVVLSTANASVMDPENAAPRMVNSVVLNEPVVELPKLELARPTASQMAYNAFDGTKDLVFGVGNAAKAGGRVVKDVAQTGLAVAEGFAGVGQALVAPFNYFYSGTEDANKNVANAKANFLSAGSNLMSVAKDMPTNFNDLKAGVIQGYEGVKKVGTSLYDAGKAVIESPAAKAVYSAAKTAASAAGSAITGWFGRAVSAFSPNFDFVNFA